MSYELQLQLPAQSQSTVNPSIFLRSTQSTEFPLYLCSYCIYDDADCFPHLPSQNSYVRRINCSASQTSKIPRFGHTVSRGMSRALARVEGVACSRNETRHARYRGRRPPYTTGRGPLWAEASISRAAWA